MDKKTQKATIEAILFAAGYPMMFEKLAEVTEVTEEEIREAVNELANEYNEEEHGHGIRMMVYENSCQLCTKETYMDAIRLALGIRRGGNLSRSSLETLAIIAYHQPVTKSYIDQIRGVDSSYAVNNLSEKHLIDVCGQLDAPGKPYLYQTTEDFLRVFGIESVSELPPVEVFGTPVLEEMLTDGENEETSESEPAGEEASNGTNGEV